MWFSQGDVYIQTWKVNTFLQSASSLPQSCAVRSPGGWRCDPLTLPGAACLCQGWCCCPLLQRWFRGLSPHPAAVAGSGLLADASSPPPPGVVVPPPVSVSVPPLGGVFPLPLVFCLLLLLAVSVPLLASWAAVLLPAPRCSGWSPVCPGWLCSAETASVGTTTRRKRRRWREFSPAAAAALLAGSYLSCLLWTLSWSLHSPWWGSVVVSVVGGGGDIVVVVVVMVVVVVETVVVVGLVVVLVLVRLLLVFYAQSTGTWSSRSRVEMWVS